MLVEQSAEGYEGYTVIRRLIYNLIDLDKHGIDKWRSETKMETPGLQKVYSQNTFIPWCIM